MMALQTKRGPRGVAALTCGVVFGVAALAAASPEPSPEPSCSAQASAGWTCRGGVTLRVTLDAEPATPLRPGYLVGSLRDPARDFAALSVRVDARRASAPKLFAAARPAPKRAAPALFAAQQAAPLRWGLTARAGGLQATAPAKHAARRAPRLFQDAPAATPARRRAPLLFDDAPPSVQSGPALFRM